MNKTEYNGLWAESVSDVKPLYVPIIQRRWSAVKFWKEFLFLCWPTNKTSRYELQTICVREPQKLNHPVFISQGSVGGAVLLQLHVEL